jgi:predicted dehydrogenase
VPKEPNEPTRSCGSNYYDHSQPAYWGYHELVSRGEVLGIHWEITCFGTAGGQGPYDDRELLARDDLHCAIIPTPCYWHTTMYCDALDAGIHFYGEKLLAVTTHGVKPILGAAAKNPPVMAQIGFQWTTTKVADC